MVAGVAMHGRAFALALVAVLVAESAQAQWRGRIVGRPVIRAPLAPRIGVGIGIGVRPVLPVRPFLPVRPIVPVRPFVPYVGRGVVVTPFYGVARAAIAAAPRVAAAAAAPIIAPAYGASQGYAAQSQYEAPVASQAPVAAPSAGAAAATAGGAYPSTAELQGMDDSGLLNSLVGVTQQLDADLARFATGAKWQGYLRLPSDALPPPTNNQVKLGMASLTTTLGRFDKIAADPAYQVISGLPSFVASHAALAEVVRRFGRQAPPQTPPQVPPQSSGVTPASAQEELPSPSFAPASGAAPANERSILSK